jgi:hypothetical protein
VAKLARNLARLEPSKGSMGVEPKRAGWNNALLASMLAQVTNL